VARPVIRNAFVLGAGLGTRLKALTAVLPKPLIPVCNKPLIAHAFNDLLASGIEKIVVNTHHRAGEYAKAFPGSQYRGCPLHFRHEPELLETGGGIKNVEDLLDDGPFIVYNGDILTDLPVEKAVAHHLASGNEVTMVLRSGGGPLQVSFDEAAGRVTDISSRIHPGAPGRFLFTGVYCVNPEFFRRIPQATKISVVPIFLEMICESAGLGGIVLDEGIWHDLGTREAYLDTHRVVAGTRHFGEAPWIHPAARVAASARIEGASAVGGGTTVGGDAVILNSIIWENAHIQAGARLENCIVTAGTAVTGTHMNEDLTA
jgi:NDP-sugar pyrophosphorylase family protein